MRVALAVVDQVVRAGHVHGRVRERHERGEARAPREQNGCERQRIDENGRGRAHGPAHDAARQRRQAGTRQHEAGERGSGHQVGRGRREHGEVRAQLRERDQRRGADRGQQRRGHDAPAEVVDEQARPHAEQREGTRVEQGRGDEHQRPRRRRRGGRRSRLRCGCRWLVCIWLREHTHLAGSRSARLGGPASQISEHGPCPVRGGRARSMGTGAAPPAPTRRSGVHAPGWIRTSDPRIRSPMLYPAELRGRVAQAAAGAWSCPLLPVNGPTSRRPTGRPGRRRSGAPSASLTALERKPVKVAPMSPVESDEEDLTRKQRRDQARTQRKPWRRRGCEAVGARV